jgi:hypothetical protein
MNNQYPKYSSEHIVTRLVTNANSGDSCQGVSSLMRKAAMKIAYLEDLAKAVKSSEFSGIDCEDVRGENWFDARKRALKAGNDE